MREVQVMLVDNHEVIRCGLKALLKRHGRLRVMAEAESVATAIAEAERTQPDVIVMDVRLPDGSGVDACRTIHARQPDTRIVMLTGYEDEAARAAAARAGAAAFLLKDVRAADLARAIEAVASGEIMLTPSTPRAARTATHHLRGNAPANEGLATLTEKQRRILGLLAEGKTNHEIAQDVALSEKTVKNAVSVILRKLGMAHRSQVAAFMARRRAWDSGERPTENRREPDAQNGTSCVACSDPPAAVPGR